MIVSQVLLRAETTVRAVARRRLSVAILVLMPIALYAANHDTVGRAARSLVFGVSWAVSTVAFFATTSSRELEPRLRLAGWSATALTVGRTCGLLAVAGALSTSYGLMVTLDQDIQNRYGMNLAFALTALVAVAVGTTVGVAVKRDLEGTLILFLLAGLQAVVNPFDTFAKALPFWSSRELSTYAVDGAEAGSLGAGLLHALIVITLCALVLLAEWWRPNGRTSSTGKSNSVNRL